METPISGASRTSVDFMTKEFLGLTACQSTRDPSAKPPLSPSSIISSDWKELSVLENFVTHFQLAPRRALCYVSVRRVLLVRYETSLGQPLF
jgi:hypothetical protein